MAKKLQLWYPIKPFVITQNFGENLVPYYKSQGLLGHNGIDMVGTTGQIVKAAHDGVVSYCGYDLNEGLGVVVRSKEPFEYKGEESYFKTIYWHLLPDSVKVKVDQEVRVGDTIGQCDSTGVRKGVNLSSDSHLHFGLKPIAQGEDPWTWWNVEQKNGYGGSIDPAPFWNGLYAADFQPVVDFLISQPPVLPTDLPLSFIRRFMAWLREKGIIK